MSALEYIAPGPDAAEAIKSTVAKLVQAVKAVKATATFHAIRESEADVQLLDVKGAEADYLRRYVIHSECYYRSKKALKLATNLSASQDEKDAVRKLRQAVKAAKDATQKSVADIVDELKRLEKDDDEPAPNASGSELPMRPFKTKSVLARPLQESDFDPPSADRLADIDVSLTGICKWAVTQYLNDRRIKSMGGRGRQQTSFSLQQAIPVKYLDPETLATVSTYMRRRLSTCVTRAGATKLTKQVLLRCIDDAISFLRSANRNQPRHVPIDERTRNYIARRGERRVASTTTSLALNWRQYAAGRHGGSWEHITVVKQYRDGFCVMALSPKYAPKEYPPDDDFERYVRMEISQRKPTFWDKIEDENVSDETEIEDGLTVGDHRRAIRWLEYQVRGFRLPRAKIACKNRSLRFPRPTLSTIFICLRVGR